MKDVPLKAVCTDAGQYGLNVSSDDYETDGVQLLRTSDLSGARAAIEPVFVSGPIAQRHRLMGGDLLLTRSGSLGLTHLVTAAQASCTFAGFLVRFRPRGDTDSRWLYYVTQSLAFQQAVAAEAVSSTISNFNAERYANLRVPFIDVREQWRIGAFLNDQIAHLDGAITQAQSIQDTVTARSVLDLGERLLDGRGRWKLDAGWHLAPVGAYFKVELGKMLNEDRAAGTRLRPYLRNTNVQWDRIDTSDLKQMHFDPGERARYGLVPGDLLICEGGQPGRAALWDAPEQEIYFQKALHRARPRSSDAEPRWLLHLLRLCVAREMFTDESGTTIAHLTNEHLRALRLPFPPVKEQRVAIAEIDRLLKAADVASLAAQHLALLLEERKRALVTACVTGEFDVSTVGRRPG